GVSHDERRRPRRRDRRGGPRESKANPAPYGHPPPPPPPGGGGGGGGGEGPRRAPPPALNTPSTVALSSTASTDLPRPALRPSASSPQKQLRPTRAPCSVQPQT